jgi:hypothetical protein
MDILFAYLTMEIAQRKPTPGLGWEELVGCAPIILTHHKPACRHEDHGVMRAVSFAPTIGSERAQAASKIANPGNTRQRANL